MSAIRLSARLWAVCRLTGSGLVEMLMADPPASYAEISDQPGLPAVGLG